MKGLYLDVPEARSRIEALEQVLGVESHLTERRTPHRHILVSAHPAAWPEGPVHENPDLDLVAAASGWVVFRERWGDLAGLAEAICARPGFDGAEEALRQVQAGAFVIWLSHRGREALVTDPFGLHPHFAPAGEPVARLAPAPWFLADGLDPDPLLDETLSRQNHLFGNLTAYREIRRLEPGSVLTAEGIRGYYDYRPAPGDLRDLYGVLCDQLRRFSGRESILPLSGGLDSRLLLAATTSAYGYTFGPAATGDRPVARAYRERFREYREFSLLDLEYPAPLREAGRRMFQGLCPRPFLELLPVYRDLASRWGEGHLFLDGYLGDVLQRHTYLTSGGVRGSLAKLLPDLTLRGFDPHAILRRRYPSIPPEVFRMLLDLYEEKTARLDLPPTHKVLLFEILHGRGARAALNGGTLLSGQYFLPVQPFFLPEVFRRLFAVDARAGLTYGAVQRIWSAVPGEFSRPRTYSGFRPTDPPHLSRATMLVTKALGKKGIFRRAVNYETEIPRIRWE